MKQVINTRRSVGASLKKRQRGMTLIELTLVLVLGGLVIFGALSMFKSANQSSSVSNETKNMQSIVAGVRALYPGQSTYPGLSGSMLISANKVPTSMVNGTALRHSWNDAVLVQPAAPSGFLIIYANVPGSACIELVSAVASGFNEVGVGTSMVKYPNSPLNVAAATLQCGSGTATVFTKAP